MAESALATFTYVSDTYQTWTVPSGVTGVRIVASGAQGSSPSSSSYAGGLGAEVIAIVPVTAGHVLWIYVPSQPWVGGGPGFSSSADGGGAAVVIDATSGELIVVAGGGGGSDGTAAGGNGGQDGSAGGGSVPGAGATSSGVGSGGVAGGGPITASTSGAAVVAAGGASSGGGGGYYSGNGGGTLGTSSSQEPNGTYTADPAVVTSSGSYSGSATAGTYTTSGSSDPSSDNGATWTYYVISGVTYSYTRQTWQAGPPDYGYSDIGSTTVSYSSDQGSGWTTSTTSFITATGEIGYRYYVYSYSSASYSQTNYSQSFTENYSTVSSNYVSETGSGGGGSSYVLSGAQDVVYSDGVNAGNGTVVFYPPALVPSVSLSSPGDGTYVNLAGTPTFTADYINTDGSECAAWQFEWIEGSTTTYWDAASAQFVASAVWNPGPGTVTFPAGTFVNGSTASWSMNLQSSYGIAYTSGFAPTFQVNGQDSPVAAITYPVASSLSSVTELELSAVPPSGLAITSWRLVVYPEAAVSASGFQWGASSPVLDTGTVAGSPPPTYVPVDLALGVGYVAGLLVTETYGEDSSWGVSGPFELYTTQGVSGGVEVVGAVGLFAGAVGWAPGYLVSSGGTVLPATVTSSVIRSFSDIDSLAFATQQSDALQLIPDDTFTSPHLQTWPFPQVTDPAYAAINDFKTVGGVGASLMADRPGVLLVQGVDPATAVSDQTISVLPTPVLAEGQMLTSQSTPSGLVSPSFVPSGAGELYLGVRFVPLTSLVAVLQLWNAVTSEVLVEWSLAAGASQAVQTWRPYAIGSLVPADTPLQLALVVEGSGNRWMLQALSAFDEGVVWEFTVDGGVNWVEATQVRNQRYGSVMFPAPGRQMQWRATFYQPDRVVSHLRIRPHYVSLRHAGGPPVRSGPSVLASSPTAEANTDPFFAGGRSPIPSSWFAPGTVRAGQMGP